MAPPPATPPPPARAHALLPQYAHDGSVVAAVGYSLWPNAKGKCAEHMPQDSVPRAFIEETATIIFRQLYTSVSKLAILASLISYLSYLIYLFILSYLNKRNKSNI